MRFLLFLALFLSVNLFGMTAEENRLFQKAKHQFRNYITKLKNNGAPSELIKCFERWFKTREDFVRGYNVWHTLENFAGNTANEQMNTLKASLDAAWDKAERTYLEAYSQWMMAPGNVEKEQIDPRVFYKEMRGAPSWAEPILSAEQEHKRLQAIYNLGIDVEDFFQNDPFLQMALWRVYPPVEPVVETGLHLSDFSDDSAGSVRSGKRPPRSRTPVDVSSSTAAGSGHSRKSPKQKSMEWMEDVLDSSGSESSRASSHRSFTTAKSHVSPRSVGSRSRSSSRSSSRSRSSKESRASLHFAHKRGGEKGAAIARGRFGISTGRSDIPNMTQIVGRKKTTTKMELEASSVASSAPRPLGRRRLPVGGRLTPLPEAYVRDASIRGQQSKPDPFVVPRLEGK